MSDHGWIGVDFDGTLAHYESWDKNGVEPGEPIAPMVARVQVWLGFGITVKVFTARVSCAEPERSEQVAIIERWCATHLGQVLPVTCSKDYDMVELWDDRAISVEHNTGRVLSDSRSREE